MAMTIVEQREIIDNQMNNICGNPLHPELSPRHYGNLILNTEPQRHRDHRLSFLKIQRKTL